MLGIRIEIDKVETEKSFTPPIGRVASRFDLFAEDTKNRIIYRIIVLTSGDKHGADWAAIDFDPKTREDKGLGEIPHKVVYLCPKYATDKTPPVLREWFTAIIDNTTDDVHEKAD